VNGCEAFLDSRMLAPLAMRWRICSSSDALDGEPILFFVEFGHGI
jgi:hypothetical protein